MNSRNFPASPLPAPRVRSLNRPLRAASFLCAAGLMAFSAMAAPAGVSTPPAQPDAKRVAFKEAGKSFEEAKSLIKKMSYRSDLSEDDLLRAAVEGMLRYADPQHQEWNALLEPEAYNDLKNDLKGEVVGIGVELRFDDKTGAATILGVGPESPAQKADLRAGDLILTVDGKGFQGKSIADMVQAIRGPKDAAVKLSLLRNGEVVKKSLKRTLIPIDAVRLVGLSGGTHLIRIPAFNDRTPQMVGAALKEFQAAKGQALVLDLRRCPGGSLDKMIETASLFLPKGTLVVSLRKDGGGEAKDLRTAGEPLFGAGKKLAVLVGAETFSGGEALAEALRLGAKAKLVGGKTHGKWSVQTIQELPNGFMAKFTISHMHAADGRSYEGKGIEPDLPVSLPDAKGDEAERGGSYNQPPGKELMEKDPVTRAAVSYLAG